MDDFEAQLQTPTSRDDPELWLPSGSVKIAIENGHRNSEFSH